MMYDKVERRVNENLVKDIKKKNKQQCFLMWFSMALLIAIIVLSVYICVLNRVSVDRPMKVNCNGFTMDELAIVDMEIIHFEGDRHD